MSFIPLSVGKHYLRVDFNDDDVAIERMLDSALSFISKRTNYVFGKQTKEYRVGAYGLCVIYDYPIHNLAEGYERKGDRVIYKTDVTLDVGFELYTDVPSDIIDAALQMVKVWYFEAEKQENTTLIPISVLNVINAHRRFTL